MAEPRGASPSLESLTFGVELELIVDLRGILETKDLEYVRSEPWEAFRYAAEAIKDYLASLTDRLKDDVALPKKEFKLPVSFGETEWGFQTWIIKPDWTIEASNSGSSTGTSTSPAGSEGGAEESDAPAYYYAGVEIVSPAFRNTAELHNECDKITRALGSLDWVKFNQTCALHVHVGRGCDGFPLLSLQKLASILWVGGEELLDMVHPSHRRTGESARCYCAPIKSDSLLSLGIVKAGIPNGPLAESWFNCCAPESGSPQKDKEREQLEVIWKVADVSTFCYLLGNRAKRLRYNFKNLDNKSYDEAQHTGQPGGSVAEAFVKRTIEFRQADGDIRREGYLVAWVKVVTSLVAWANDADEMELGRVARDVCEHLPANNAQTVARFLGNIGVPQDAVAIMVRRIETMSELVK